MQIRLKATFLTLLLSACCLAPAHAEQILPSFAQVRANYHPSDAMLLDRHGEPLEDLRFDPSARRAEWQSLATLPATLREALLAAEDKRFFEHAGVDWVAVAGAAWQNLWSDHKRGASTLTMQLAGLLDPALHMPGAPGARRSVSQKWNQGLAAVELEKHWSKAQILEAYLNLAPFRGELEGVEAASEWLFGLPASALTRREACILAALLRGPNAPPPLVAKRACLLASKLNANGLCPDITQLAKARLDLPRSTRYSLAPHAARLLLKHPGQKLVSNLDASTQRKVADELKTWSDAGAAAIVLDNATGDVLAWVGGQTPNHPDGVATRYPVTDWAWPHLAALALDRKQLTAATPLTDVNLILDANDARLPHTWHSLRFALNQHQAGSLRQLNAFLSRETVHERLRNLGLEPNDGPIDGINHLSLFQLSSAWRTLSAGGNFVPARLVQNDISNRAMLKPEAAAIVSDILGQSRGSSWDAFWVMPSAPAGETVIIGHTERYTVAARGAMPNPRTNWLSLLKALGADTQRAPAMPDGVQQDLIYFDPAEEPPRREFFLRHAELNGMVSYLPDRRARIVEPQAGSEKALSDAQDAHLSFTAVSAVPVHWVLDGHPLGEGIRVDWLAQPGTHHLSLRGANDDLLDSVDFSVSLPPAAEPPSEERQ